MAFVSELPKNQPIIKKSRISPHQSVWISGIVFIIGSVVLLYWNEGKQDLSLLLTTAQDISSLTKDARSSFDGKLVSTSGIVSSDEVLGDKFLKPDKYVAIQRNVETYQLKKDSRNDGQIKLTRHYEWTPKSIKTLIVKKMYLDSYRIDPDLLTILNLSPLRLTPENTVLQPNSTIDATLFIYISASKQSSPASPLEGDSRIRYSVFPSGAVGTLFGELRGNAILPFYAPQNLYSFNYNLIYHLFHGTRSEAIANVHREFNILQWAFRILALLPVWVGFYAIIHTLNLYTPLPLFGTRSGKNRAGRLFLTAILFVLLVVTIFSFFYSLFTLLICVGGIIAGLFIIGQWLKRKTVELPSTKIPSVP